MHNFIYIYHFLLIGAASNEYYFGFFKNYHSIGEASVILTTTGSQSVNYTIQAPGIGYSNSGTVLPSAESTITLPNSVQVSSYADEHKGVFLSTSNDQVVVMGQMLRLTTSDTFLILPLTKQFTTEYVYYGMSITGRGSASSTLLVGIKNNTMLNLTVSQSVTISVGGAVSNLIPGRSYSFVINRLQTLFIGSADDITGTRIVTNQPVSVFSGHECANIPVSVGFCDYIIEQIPPTILWGKVYYVTSLATRSRSTIKVLAGYDSTNVDIYCDNLKISYTINQGAFITRIIGQQSCAIYASKEVLVAQFSHGGDDDSGVGDPMMMLVPPTTQYFNKFTISTIQSSWEHYVNVIVFAQYYQPDMIYLLTGGINSSLNTQQWTSVRVNNFIEAYITRVNVQEGVVKISHANASALMTTMVYGFSGYVGYGHPGQFHDITGIVSVQCRLICKMAGNN